MRWLVAAALLAGCATLPYTQMTADQISALGKVKDSSVTCVSGTYAGAKATTIMVNVDKGIPAGITVDENCKMTFDGKSGNGPKP